jgi:hypothetical protein
MEERRQYTVHFDPPYYHGERQLEKIGSWPRVEYARGFVAGFRWDAPERQETYKMTIVESPGDRVVE